VNRCYEVGNTLECDCPDCGSSLVCDDTKCYKVVDNSNGAIEFPIGDWLLENPQGLLCSGVYKSEKDARKWCYLFNIRRHNQRIDDDGALL
jgi:hypothetical protein